MVRHGCAWAINFHEMVRSGFFRTQRTPSPKHVNRDIGSIRGGVAAVAVKDRLRAAFRQMSQEGISTERRVRKVLPTN